MKRLPLRFLGFAMAGFALAFVTTSAALAQTEAAAPVEPQAPDGMQLFLLIGQSNMAGRGKVEEQDKVTNPRIWMLDKEMKWVPARDPLHFDKGSAGVGLGSEFARTLANADPKVNIGLIPAAFGGTSMDQWKAGGQLYKDAVSRTREASKKGTLAGILWHQGESDRAPARVATYPERFSKMIAQLRVDLNAADAPLVIGELGRFRADQTEFNAMLPELVKLVPHCGLATAEDLKDRGDNLHFDSAALREFGKRYAAVYVGLRNGKAGGK